MTTRQHTFQESVNPATGEVNGRFPLATPEAIERALMQSRWAFRSWRDTSFEERAALFHQAAAYLRSERSRLASLITIEMGKPIVEAEAEIEKCAWGCDFYADNAARFLADEPHDSNASESYVTFEPLGTILAIMPWNFPFWQAFRFAAPALMAGNTAILKHASNVPQSALAIGEVFEKAGFPKGVFQTLLISAGDAENLIADPRIAAVSLTGSDAAGSKVASTAGRELKKSVLELGGSDPYIVLEDADLDEAAAVAVAARNRNAGQSCIAAKRLIVVDSVFDAFLERFVAGVRALRIGDPSDRSTEIGPLAREDLRTAIDRQVSESAAMGAKIVAGGKYVDGPGYFYEPTVLVDVNSNMPVLRQETFGPAVAVVRVRDEEEAIRLANDTAYGLSSAIWTRDIERGKRLARRIEAGGVFINGMSASDLRLPFGGVKRSGYGRELSEYGIREFVNIKTVWIGPAEEQPKPELKSE